MICTEWLVDSKNEQCNTYADVRCDLQVVTSGTAANNMAIVLKQLRTSKCANWDELATMREILAGRYTIIMSVVTVPVVSREL